MISAIKKAVAKVYDPYVAARQAFMDASIYPKGERQMSSVLDVLSQEQIRVSVLELLQTDRDRIVTDTRLAMKEDVREEVFQEALRYYEADRERAKQKVEDEKADCQDQVGADIQDRIDAGLAKEREKLEEKYATRYESLKERVAALTEQANDSDLALIELLKEMFPLGLKVYPNRRLTVRALPIEEINNTLKRHGLMLRPIEIE